MSIDAQVACQDPCNSCTRETVPEFRASRLRKLAFDEWLGSGQDGRGIVSEESVRSLGDGNRTLRVWPQCKPGNAQRGRFLLDAPAVGHQKARLVHERE